MACADLGIAADRSFDFHVPAGGDYISANARCSGDLNVGSADRHVLADLAAHDDMRAGYSGILRDVARYDDFRPSRDQISMDNPVHQDFASGNIDIAMHAS